MHRALMKTLDFQMTITDVNENDDASMKTTECSMNKAEIPITNMNVYAEQRSFQ